MAGARGEYREVLPAATDKRQPVMLGRLTPRVTDWEQEFYTPLMREALVRTLKDELARHVTTSGIWRLSEETPEARWQKEGRICREATDGATPCWVWWAELRVGGGNIR